MGTNRKKRYSDPEEVLEPVLLLGPMSHATSVPVWSVEKNPSDITEYRSGLMCLKETKYILCDLSKFLKYLG